MSFKSGVKDWGSDRSWERRQRLWWGDRLCAMVNHKESEQDEVDGSNGTTHRWHFNSCFQYFHDANETDKRSEKNAQIHIANLVLNISSLIAKFICITDCKLERLPESIKGRRGVCALPGQMRVLEISNVPIILVVFSKASKAVSPRGD